MGLVWSPDQAGPGDLSGGSTVFPPAIVVDDTGGGFDITATFVWGVTEDGEPYYNASGVAAGDEALLVFDGTSGEFFLRPVEV